MSSTKSNLEYETATVIYGLLGLAFITHSEAQTEIAMLYSFVRLTLNQPIRC